MQSNTLLVLVFSLSALMVSAQAKAQPSEPRMTKSDYIAKYADHAVREMHASGVPASITLAQGMLESDYGNSPLAKYANNHFGIKCHKGWTGPSFIQDDDEANECFRKYYSPHESYRDHSEFLRTRDRYAFLFDLKTTDYKGWSRGLKKAGYATNPKYADLLIRIIEENNLQQYDKVVKLPDNEVLANVAEAEYADEKKKREEPPILNVPRIEVSANNIKFILAKEGDTPMKIAKRHDMGAWQIRKYNDLKRNESLTPGDVIYLQPKRNHAKEDTHTVLEGETLRDISQKHGVKMKRILKLNGLEKDYVPKAGDKLKLRSVGPLNAMFTGR